MIGDKKIYGFYHILMCNDWQQIIREQISSIEESGLLDITDKIFIGCLGSENDLNILKEFLIGKEKFEIKYHDINEKMYEFCTLNMLYQMSLEEDFLCYYFHAKGASINSSNMTYYFGSTNLEHLKACVRDWRIFMEYFCFYKFLDNVKHLETYDCCGVNFSHQSPHFSGNFWWSKSSYIKTLYRVDDFQYRYLAETWLFTKSPKHFDFYFYPLAGYASRLDHTSYKTKN